jgi:hypothetical protein
MTKSNQLAGSKLRGIKKIEFMPRSSPPNVFIGVQSEDPPGFHFDKLSVASPVEPPLKACGKDGLREGANSTQQAAENSTRLD